MNKSNGCRGILFGLVIVLPLWIFACYALAMCVVGVQAARPTPTPQVLPDRVYLPQIVSNGAEIHIVGRILQTDGTPYPGQIVHAGEVWCDGYSDGDFSGREDCALVVDIAWTPAACTDKDGYYDIVIDGWMRDNVKYWVLVIGNVEMGDYEIIYDGDWDSTVIGYTEFGHTYLRDDIVSDVSQSYCPTEPYPAPGVEGGGRYEWDLEAK